MRNRPENQIEIRLTLIRHGATLSNKEGRYLGKTDEALSPDGMGQKIGISKELIQ
jgi:alpha-ribazole phosphatase